MKRFRIPSRKSLSRTEWYLLAVTAGILLAAALTVLLESRGRPGLVERVPDFAAIQDVNERKDAFFEFILPYVQEQNAILMRDRARIQAIEARLQRGSRPSRADVRWVLQLSEQMGLEAESLEEPDFFSNLLTRVDAIPPLSRSCSGGQRERMGDLPFRPGGEQFFWNMVLPARVWHGSLAPPGRRHP